MSRCGFDFSVAEQLTFVVSRSTLNKILCDLSGKCREAKVRALLQLRLTKHKVLVKVVPGKCENECHCGDDFRRILKDHCVRSECQKVLIVEFGKDAVRDVAHVNRLFVKKCIEVTAFYFDRCGNGVYQVCDLKKAKCVLKGDRSSSSSSSSDSCDKRKNWFDRKDCDDKRKDCDKSKDCDRRKSCDDKRKDCGDKRKDCDNRKHDDRKHDDRKRDDRKRDDSNHGWGDWMTRQQDHGAFVERRHTGACAGAK